MTSYYHTWAVSREQIGDIVKQLLPALSRDRNSGKFNCIVVTGISGAKIGPVLAYLLRVNCIFVRRSVKESEHSESLVEGTFPESPKVLIVDDFISSGKTLQRIKDAVLEHNNDVVQITGVAVYSDNDYCDRQSRSVREILGDVSFYKTKKITL